MSDESIFWELPRPNEPNGSAKTGLTDSVFMKCM